MCPIKTVRYRLPRPCSFYIRRVFPEGGAPDIVYFPVPQSENHRNVYFGYTWKPSVAWQGHSSAVNKLSFLWWGNGGAYTGYVIPEMYGAHAGPFHIEMFIFGANNAHIPECAYQNAEGNPCHFSPDAPVMNITLGQWHRIEVLVRQSLTPGAQDGLLRWWMDGVLLGERTNINTVSDPMIQFEFSPTWGGVGDTKTQDDYFWFDHTRISSGGIPGGGQPPSNPPPAAPLRRDSFSAGTVAKGLSCSLVF